MKKWILTMLIQAFLCCDLDREDNDVVYEIISDDVANECTARSFTCMSNGNLYDLSERLTGLHTHITNTVDRRRRVLIKLELMHSKLRKVMQERGI